MDVQIQKEQQSPVEYQLQVTVPAELMADRIRSEMDKVAANIKLPGFRPGHIPRRVLVERFGKAVTQEVLQDVLQEAYRDALEQSALAAVSPGEMDDVQFQQGEPLTFKVKVEVAPEIQIPELSEVSVELLEPAVEDEDVLRALDQLREQHAVIVPTEDPVDNQSIITVDLQELDPSGLPIVGRSQKGMQVDMSHSHLGEEFDSKLLGLGLDQKTTVEFPVSGGEGEKKSVRYEVVVKNIQRKELPPLDDELAKAVNPELGSLDDLKRDLKNYIEARARHSARERMFQTVVEELLRRTDFPVPPRMLEDYLERMAHDAIHRHQHKHTPELEEKEIAEFKEHYRATAVFNMRWYLLRKKLVEARGLEVTDDEYKTELERLAQIDGVATRGEFEKKLKPEQKEHIREDLLERKVLAVIAAEVQTIPRAVSLAEFEGRTPGRVVTV